MSMALLAFPFPLAPLLPTVLHTLHCSLIDCWLRMQKVFPLFRSRGTQAAGMQRADWQRTCGRAAIFCRHTASGSGSGRGGGIVVPGVNYKDKAEQRARAGGWEKGQGRKGKTSRNLAKCFGRNLCAAHANICRGRSAAEGEWGRRGEGGRQLGLQSIDGWLHRSSDASESHRSIGKVAKRSDPNRT